MSFIETHRSRCKLIDAHSNRCSATVRVHLDEPSRDDVRSRPGSVGSVELKHESKGLIDLEEFIESYPPYAIPQPFIGNGRCLFDKNLSGFVIDVDCGPKYSLCGRPRCGCDEHGREQQVLRLE